MSRTNEANLTKKPDCFDPLLNVNQRKTGKNTKWGKYKENTIHWVN